ncbi:MAG: hypothetical protein R3D98_14465 [Candidatus Krumholzibacteriia bacterium]
MDSLNPQARPSARKAAVVEAPTLKDALRQVRQRYGDDARVIRSRTITRREPAGLGTQKVVEVLVEPSGDARGRQGLERSVERRVHPWSHLSGEIAAEVERIEGLVQQIARDQARRGAAGAAAPRNRLAAALLEAGAEPQVLARQLERCRAETGAREDDRAAFLDYLTANLPTGRGDWRDFGGTHVFLGPSGSGRTALLLAVAARLAGDGRQVLVLSLLPQHGGDVRRLQAAAADHGYDAAVIQKPRQLVAARDHLAGYDVVLIDTPALGQSDRADAAALCREIVANPAYHRHLVIPLDRDLRDTELVLQQAREIHCDWLALTRLDQTRLRGKALNLLDRMPLPVSMVGDPTAAGGEPQLATPGLLLDLMLAGARGRAHAEG